MNTGSGTSASFLRKNHTFCHPVGGSDIGKQKYGLTPGQTRQRYQHCPTLSLPRPSSVIVGRKRNNSTNQSGAQSLCRPRTGARMPIYAGSPKESSHATPSHRTIAASEKIDVKAHQILACRMSRTPRRIPPAGAGDAGSSGTQQVANSTVVIYP
jgi:hypothetical protein